MPRIPLARRKALRRRRAILRPAAPIGRLSIPNARRSIILMRRPVMSLALGGGEHLGSPRLSPGHRCGSIPLRNGMV
jgi:hypothetical protein